MSRNQSDSSEYFSITPEELITCSNHAERLPLRPPRHERWLDSDQMLWRVGNFTFKVLLTETFHDLIQRHLVWTYGSDWARSQHDLAESDRHVVVRWTSSLYELEKESKESNAKSCQRYQIPPTGHAMEFMSHANDLYWLRRVNALRPKMIDRLRHHKEFQGARYECSVAASFVQAGFNIEWQSGAGTKCEFIATNQQTGESIAVEVKSRRRAGTLNEGGKPLNPRSLRLDSAHLYEKALGQCPNHIPCGIFIDVNLPHETGARDAGIPWRDDIQYLLNQCEEPTPESPAKETCLFFTNTGWHFTGDQKAKGNQYVCTFPSYVRSRLSNMNTFVAILQGANALGKIPSWE